MQKFIQSCWISEDNNKWNAGWLNLKFHLMGWALSAYSIHKYHDNLHLYTNSEGAEILLQKLQLPYSSHELIFEDYQTEFKTYGFLKKLRAYSQIQSPFLHIDGDAFLFEPLPSALVTAPLVAQNYEYNHPCYEKIYAIIKANFSYLPAWLHPNERGYISAANTGLVGGLNCFFYQELEKEVLYFLEQNRDFLHLPTPHIDFCVFLEQAFFQCMAEQQQISVAYLLPEKINETLNYRLDRFQDVPRRCGYLHLMNYKRNPTACEQMAQRLWLESPELYERCERVARQLEATHHAVSVTIPSKLAFEGCHRTATLPQDAPQAIYEDVTNYEKEKKEWVESLPPINALWERWQRYSKEANERLALPEPLLLAQKLQPSVFSKRLVSEWNWVEVNEFAGQDRTHSYDDNLQLTPAYYEVILYIYLHQGVIKEQLLDTLGILLLDAFEVPQSLEEGLKTVWQQIYAYQTQTNESFLKETLMSRIRFYLYQGILEFAY